MKTATFSILAALALGFSAQADTYTLDSSVVDLTIDVTHRPMFPISLQQQGYSEGKVTIAFEVDNYGELRDWLVLEATHPAFAEAIERVIDRWKFSPPKINGESRSIVSRLKIYYHSTGNVLSFDLGTSLSTVRLNEITGWQSERLGLARIKDLDSPPKILASRNPSVPAQAIERYKGSSAVFTFYVDETGSVRIPALQRVDGDIEPAMLLAAQDALTQWTFDPPKVRSKPATIKLSQTFVFNTK